MKDSIALQIILQIILIALNAVFACAEIAVISMNDNKLAKMAENGDKRAVRLARLTSQPARFWQRYRWQLPCRAFWEAHLPPIISQTGW